MQLAPLPQLQRAVTPAEVSVAIATDGEVQLAPLPQLQRAETPAEVEGRCRHLAGRLRWRWWWLAAAVAGAVVAAPTPARPPPPGSLIAPRQASAS